MSGDVPVGAFIMFGVIIAILLLINLEVLKVSRETRSELYTAVRHIADEIQILRDSHEEHVNGSTVSGSVSAEPPKPFPQEKRTIRRRSTDYADWVTDSGIGDKK